MKNSIDRSMIDTRRVDVIDGIRAISVIIVMVFHFWQQTWIFPFVRTPFLGWAGINVIDFSAFARVGYLFVDMMILISGFLLFLPVARNVFLFEPLPKWREYFKRRAVRILPSYLFCIILLFVYELMTGGYGDPINSSAAVRDLVLHLLFLHTWTVPTYLSTRLNVVLWTLAVEVWFYILFPLFASFIKRRKNERGLFGPIFRAAVTAIVMFGIAAVYIYAYVLRSGSVFSNGVDGIFAAVGSGIRSSYLAMVINQLPAFFGSYAIGLIGAFIYVAASKNTRRKWWTGAIGTVLSIVFIYVIVRMVKGCASLTLENAQNWQITNRFTLAFAFMGFILSASFASSWFRFLFSNPLMRFLSTISYNLYIWHQWLCVKIKYDWRIPFWEGDIPPNQWGTSVGKTWSNKYALIITIAAFAAAILVTFLIERPAADLLNGRPSIYNGKLRKKQ